MINYIKAELLKQKRGFNNRLVWLMPLSSIAMVFLLMGPKYIFTGGYNWWYILFLPFSVSYMAAGIVKKDEKQNYHGMLLVADDKEKLWYAKVFTGTVYLGITTVIMLIMMLTGSKILGLYDLRTGMAVSASLLIFITFAWQIPFYMFISEKTGSIVTVITALILDMGVACFVAESLWWIPVAIPARIMCPVTGILPNGLPVTDTLKSIKDPGVILPGILITVVLYAAMTIATAKFFRKKEV